jgi:hypothetical protein
MILLYQTVVVEEIMLSSNLIRWGAVAAMVAGVLSVVLGVLSIPLLIEEGSEGTGWYILESARAASLAVGLLGLYLYLRRQRRFGRLGTVGFYMLIVVTVADIVIYSAFALTEGRGTGVQWFDAQFGPLHPLLLIFGILLFGMGILRAGSLSRAGAWLWILAALIFVGILVGIVTGVAPIYNWGFLLADGLFGLGAILLGYGLWSHRDEPFQATQPAR